MYKIAGVGLMGLFIFMILPTNAGLTDTYNIDGVHYGAATIVVHDVNGNERFSQTVHNLLTDDGEDFIIAAVFDEGTGGPASNVAIGAICISDPNGALQVIDTEQAADFDGDNSITAVNCKQDHTGGVQSLSGVAQIGALTFNATGNLASGETVEGIGICLNNGANTADFLNCATTGILFSVINTSNVTIASGEDIDITYTFDISSPSN